MWEIENEKKRTSLSLLFTFLVLLTSITTLRNVQSSLPI